MVLLPMEKYALIVGGFFLIAVMFAPFFLKLRRKARKTIRAITHYEHENGMDDLMLAQHASTAHLTAEQLRGELSDIIDEVGLDLVRSLDASAASTLFNVLGNYFTEFATKPLPHLLSGNQYCADKVFGYSSTVKPAEGTIGDAIKDWCGSIHRSLRVKENKFIIDYWFMIVTLTKNTDESVSITAEFNENTNWSDDVMRKIISLANNDVDGLIEEFAVELAADVLTLAIPSRNGEMGALSTVLFWDYIKKSVSINYFTEYEHDLTDALNYHDIFHHSAFGHIVFSKSITLAELMTNDRGGLFCFIETMDAVKEGVRSIEVYPRSCSLYEDVSLLSHDALKEVTLIANSAIVNDSDIPSGMLHLIDMEYLFYYVQLASILKIIDAQHSDVKVTVE